MIDLAMYVVDLITQERYVYIFALAEITFRIKGLLLVLEMCLSLCVNPHTEWRGKISESLSVPHTFF